MCDTEQLNYLGIPSFATRACRKSISAILVPEAWVRLLKNGRFMALESRFYEELSNKTELLLAPSNITLPKLWTRLYVQTVPKSTETVTSLVEGQLCYDGNDLTFGEVAYRAGLDFWQNVERTARQKYSHAFATQTSKCPLPNLEQSKLVEQLLRRLFKCQLIDITAQNPTAYPTHFLHNDSSDICHPNVLPAVAILSTETHYIILYPYKPFTLLDIVNLSPAMLSKSYAKNLFLVYQILQTMRYCHGLGLTIGDLNLGDLYVNEKLWLNVLQPQMGRVFLPVTEKFEQSCQKAPLLAPKMSTKYSSCQNGASQYAFDAIIEKHSKTDLATLTQMWVYGQLSNYEYLIVLNYLAGRRMGDPNHHPVLPWILDFSSPNAGYRNLSKSKYRLNKGDQQLDVTYKSADFSLPTAPERLHIPHHISDVLSDITYYVYKARQTPKDTLCTYVRPNWVPHEYPASIQRMQEWTPDECIPEFFIDPTVFSSIHPDLPDLEVPEWASSPQDFVNKHMAELEGFYVSQYLNHWIDLTFGYKLSGQAAVRAKNVCLQLVDDHTHLVKHGVVQLFTTPHPQKLSPHPPWTPSQLKMQPSSSNVFSVESMPDINAKNQKDKKSKPTPQDKSGEITLPSGFNPMLMLEKFETLAAFTGNETKTLPTAYEPQKVIETESWFAKQSLVSRDLQSLACAIVCLLLNHHTRSIGAHAPLGEKFALCRRVCKRHWSDIPRPFREMLRLLFRLEKPTLDLKPDKYGALFQYEVLSDKKLPPPNVDLLLHSQFNIIPFSPYFPAFFDLLYKYHIIEKDVDTLRAVAGLDLDEKVKKICSLHKDMVSIFAKFCNRTSFETLGKEGVELLLPYVEHLFSSQDTAVHAVWLLFAPISLMLGPDQTKSKLLKHVVAVFDDETTTSKHIKLYHRSFVIQLIVRLGLETFLNQFSKPLIEACAGYKDFIPNPTGDKNFPHENEDVMEHSITDTFLNESASPQHVNFSLGADVDSLSSFNEENQNEESNQQDNSDYFQNLLCEQDASNSEESKTDKLDDSKFSEENHSESSGDPNESIGSEEMHAVGSIGQISIHSVSRLMALEEREENRKSPKLDTQIDEIATQAVDLCEEDNENVYEEIPDSKLYTDHSKLPGSMTIPPPSIDTGISEYNISNVAAETIKWMSHRLGPVLTAKYLSRNLLRMLAVCYLGPEQLATTNEKEIPTSLTGRIIVGDVSATHVLDCLSSIAIMYGEHVILLQYFTHIKQLVMSAQNKLTVRGEAGLIGCLSLLIHIIPFLSDSLLMDILQDSILPDSMMPILRIVSSSTFSFPNGSLARRVICFKLIDVLYIVSMRIGFEMTRVNMTMILHNFFIAFNKVWNGVGNGNPSGDENGSGKPELNGEVDQEKNDIPSESKMYALKMDSETKDCKIENYVPQQTGHRRQPSEGSRYSLSPPVEEEQDSQTYLVPVPHERILQELKETFTPDVAHAAYIPFCRLAGDIHIGQTLANDDLIRQLCAIHDQTLLQQKLNSPDQGQDEADVKSITREDSTDETEGFGRNVSFVGNQITFQGNHRGSQSGEYTQRQTSEKVIPYELLKSGEMELNSQRHLRGNWLQYWEHEVGLVDQQDNFNFKQIKLMTCTGPESWGHSNSVRALCVLDNENSFLSCSKDKTVKLWSLRNFGDGTGKVGCQWTYQNHKKSVFAVTFIDSLRYAASCDSVVHVWDPFVGMAIRTFESGKNPPAVTVLTSMPSPFSTLISATTDSVVRILDVRKGQVAHELRCTTGPAGLIRCATVSPDAHWIAVGYSTGVVSLVDARTGMLMASWKAHEGEILQIKAYSNKKIVTSSFDQSMAVWSTEDAKITNPLRGVLEPVHCFSFYKNYVISASTANKIGVHSILESKGSCSTTKLTNDVFRGVLTTMAVLPMNRLLLLGADNGQIRLVA